MTRADTIARYVNAYTNALGRVVSNTVGYMAAADSEERGRIQRDLHAAMEQSRQHLHLAFLECLGGAAVAGEEAGPWVVRLPGGRWWDGLNHREHLADAVRFRDQRVAYQWAVDGATVLPLAEAERMEAAATLASLPAHTRKVLAELADEEPSAEVLAADDSQDEPVDPCARCGQERAHLLHAPISPGALCHGVGPLRDVYAHPFVAAAPTPEPPKPAGWVVRWGIPGSYRFSQGIGVELGVSDPTDAHVYTSKADAEADARTVKHEVCVLPAAGNVIEAEGIGATLRREECERKAARQSGVAWEAARAGEEAERLRGELAAVKAERDKVLSNAAVLDTSLRRLRTDHATTLAERDALAAEVRRAREQKPVRWGFLDKTGAVVCTTSAPEPVSPESGYRVAPLYLAPVVRDHSGVIAQCEEALREWDREGPHCSATSSLVAVTLTKARNALQGAS